MNFPALPFSLINTFLMKFRTRRNTATPVVKFVIHTGARSGEVCGGIWGEIDDAVKAAYQREDLLKKRRALLDDWAVYCGTPAGQSWGNSLKQVSSSGPGDS
tara:strand:+ start:83122 stop:83427 length:306 start_codon:yes stop_codon:yes gene_type:complete